ncbi:MAG: SDR family oxidoreductase [Myxococcales bacterium]|nr:SDR family oxidoreductase [Myxococcales bacterium]
MTTALVTGCNRGIGLELCRLLIARGTEVVAAVRRTTPELEQLGAEVVAGVDVTKADGIGRLQTVLSDRMLALLINNAGILRRTPLDPLDPEAIREQFEVNALGPLRLTAAMQARLARGSKVALITSRMGSIADNTSGGSYGYRMSKAALNMAGKSLAVDLAPAGASVAILHPGWVKTDMTGGTGHVTAAESAGMLLARIDSLTEETSGTFWHANGEVLPW